MSPVERAHILHRARSYPYDAPRDSYTWDNGDVRPFAPTDRADRTPVLAFGSNRAPERLGQKFAHLGIHKIPVERAWLADFDVVYAAHVTSYAAVPAMLQRAKGVICEIAVTWLDADQLTIMHHSEMSAANYAYARLDGVSLRLDGGETVDRAFCYVGTRGHLIGMTGGMLPLSAVRATGRTELGIATGQALELIRARVAPEAGEDAFVFDLASNPTYRRRVTNTISADAAPFAYPAAVLSES